MDSKTIVVSPREFFRERVSEASHSLKIDLSQDIEFYIVNLLCEFIKPEKLNEALGTEQTALDMPLVVMMQKAYEAGSPEQRLQILRGLGDTSLYMSGYFQDYFNRKTFDIKYYMDVGSMAYENVSNLCKARSEHQMYHELSANFSTIVDIVAEISDSHQPKDNKDVLVLYDRWARSHSERLRKILTNLGIDPIATPIKIAQ
jgi:hypothetical protein